MFSVAAEIKYSFVTVFVIPEGKEMSLTHVHIFLMAFVTFKGLKVFAFVGTRFQSCMRSIERISLSGFLVRMLLYV